MDTPEIEESEPRAITWEDVVSMYEKMGLNSLPDTPTHILINGKWVPYYGS